MAIELNTVKTATAPQAQSASNATSPGTAVPASEQAESQQKVQKVESPSREQVEAAVSKLSEFAQSVNRSLNFSVDDNLGKTVITVTDRETDEIVRQIPSEEFIDLSKDLQSLQGQLLRTSA